MSSENQIEEQLRKAFGEPSLGSFYEVVALVRRLEADERRHAREIESLKAEIESMKEDQVIRERRTLIAGVSTLGAMVLGLVGVIWQLVRTRVFGG